MACDAPKDYTVEDRDRWTVASLRQAALEAEYVQTISNSTVWRILNEAELRPHHHRMWLHSPDPDFASKVSEGVGLYLNPPADSVVLSIDEKTAMQAVERKHPGRLPGLGFCGRREFEYRRHGTQTLLAALNVHTGQVFGQCRDRRTAQDLLDFMNDVAQLYPKRPIHVVWDNLNIHRGVRWEEFNRNHEGRFHFHFTPLHASWVNQIECWFSILARRVLRYGSYTSRQQLAERVLGFITHWNRYESRPFRWTFKGYPLQMGLAA